MRFIIVSQFGEDQDLRCALSAAGHMAEVRTQAWQCHELWVIPEVIVVIGQCLPRCLRPSSWDRGTGDDLARHLIGHGCRVARRLYHNQLPLEQQGPKRPLSEAPNEWLRQAWQQQDADCNPVGADALGIGYIRARLREQVDQEVQDLLALLAAHPT